MNNCNYPIVVKSNIGFAASGVFIIKNKRKAKYITKNIFGRIHPLFAFGQCYKRKKWGISIPVWGNTIKHTMLVQEFHKIKWEWRIIKIGNSFCGHQKLLNGEFASGSNKVGWVEPPKALFDMVRKICDKGNFYSMAVDILETTDGLYYVNELQSLFGSYLNSQMYINNIPGRYKFIDQKYVFKKGEFNKYGSNLLRVKHFIEIIQNSKLDKTAIQ